MDLSAQYFSLEEICYATQNPSQTIIEIVNQGIVEPEGAGPETWLFNTQMISVTKRACRLHRDLEIDWSGIALAISLIEELDQLRDENQRLRKRLERFLDQ
ncbi:chaperone modulatory protein CbpM [Porticoccaceae bacterium]|jgi:chaperone modulatory protein CbpM|nr:chaperone modulatory protein CbpM [Porticoccaceae bacterium]MDC3261280.1 chaperone modulatory protein CbpM [bacterium]MDC3261286.1 chaperone modulatory protein CbpM [bacterium]